MSTYRIAVIGGTGPQGKGLGYRFARHGHTVVLGSRAAEKAADVAREVSERLDGVDGDKGRGGSRTGGVLARAALHAREPGGWAGGRASVV